QLPPEAFAPLGDSAPTRPIGSPSLAYSGHAQLPTPHPATPATPFPVGRVHGAAPLATPAPTLPSPYAANTLAAPQPHPATRSLSWLWIVLGIVALLLIAWTLAFCGTCVVAAGS
ncbi:MAG: hypothetical protein IT375_00140, partial [Polyangiaceae bacterium]|nr:hypothetical protein [Polyangiaceae bacterium]